MLSKEQICHQNMLNYQPNTSHLPVKLQELNFIFLIGSSLVVIVDHPGLFVTLVCISVVNLPLQDDSRCQIGT